MGSVGSVRTGARRSAGMTLIELMVVVAIVGAATAMAIPQMRQYQSNQRAAAAARKIAGALHFARTQALATGNNHIVYFATSSTDACGNDIRDPQGNLAPLVVIDDGAPGSGNCCIGSGELVHWEYPVQSVNYGVTFAAAASPDDTGGGTYSTGSSFAQPGGTQARWVGFRPDGIPVAFNTGCTLGTTGTGAGGVYVTNAERDYSVLLSPLGSVKIQRFNRGANAWVD
jgi:prepilin-type N-terminal cleavage/methylation domain-containing protein